MYLQHFGLNELPFSITPDTDFFFSSESSKGALNTLLVAVRTGEGFIKITGEVGTGKTLLCRKLIESLKPDCKVAYIPNPYLEPHSLFMELAAELEVAIDPVEQPNQYQLLKMLTGRLLEIIREGKRVVICLDEAQAMPIETLEALRLLTNLETEKRKLLQVVIFGQPELEDKLNHPSIRQLKQRIAFDYDLGALLRDELDYYVHHRLVVSGYQGGRLFTPLALWLLQLKTHRIPRLVNILAHKSMLCAFGKGHTVVGLRDVLTAANDTASLRQPKWFNRPGIFVAILVAVSIASLGWIYLK
ncbi:MAG: AAA family ATPase [Rugosibacter sp.]|jgi:MSHA biogenesis protein MshM|nr:MSHA biogenesis protein MshM [Rugosibacter sp.]